MGSHSAPKRRVDIVLLMVCQSTQSLSIAGIALFLPLIRDDMNLTFSQAGSLSAAATLSYAAMQVPAGYLADRFGARPLFMTGLLGASALSFSLAVAGSYEFLLANQFFSGIFRSLLFAPGMALMGRHFPVERRATAMGLFVAGGFSSNIFLNSLGPVLIDPLGWRTLFMLFSGLGFVFLALFWRMGTRESFAVDAPEHAEKLRTLLRHPVLWLCGGIQFVRLAVVQGLAFWLPSFLVEDRGFSLSWTGGVVAAGAVFTAPANIFGGYISDRLQRPVGVVTSCLAVLAATLATLAVVDSNVVIVLAIVVNAVFVQLYFGPLFDIPVKVFGSHVAGVTSGFSNLCATLGALTLTYTIGSLKDATGSFGTGFGVLAGLCGIALVLSTVLNRFVAGEPWATRVPIAVVPDA